MIDADDNVAIDRWMERQIVIRKDGDAFKVLTLAAVLSMDYYGKASELRTYCCTTESYDVRILVATN